METTQKTKIQIEVARLSRKDSQAQVAKRAKVSTATISQVLNNNWELIRDEMWRKIAINLHIQEYWNTAEIENLKIITNLCLLAQKQALSICFSHNAGTGKTHSFREYSSSYKNVIHGECGTYWTTKIYIQQLCLQAGIDSEGKKAELIERFIDHVKSLHKPLIIIDQFDKLKDSSVDLFIDFYNELLGNCGFALSGVPALEKRILRGRQNKKSGYDEIYSRINRKFIKLEPISEHDVEAICMANGVQDEDAIYSIYNIADGDLRIVKKEVEKYFIKKSA